MLLSCKNVPILQSKIAAFADIITWSSTKEWRQEMSVTFSAIPIHVQILFQKNPKDDFVCSGIMKTIFLGEHIYHKDNPNLQAAIALITQMS